MLLLQSIVLVLMMFNTVSAFKFAAQMRSRALPLSVRRLAANTNFQAAPETAKNYLEVPFEEKDEVKGLGARWDKDSKRWFVPDGVDETKFSRWRRVYLNVPFNDKAEAKAQGAHWDATEQKWFVNGWNPNLAKFGKWMGAALSETAKASPAAPIKKPLPSPENAIVILDLDTNGLPTQQKGKKPEFTDLICFDSSRIVQLSYALCDKNTFDSLESGTYVIKTDGFPIENTQYHGISEQISKSTGMPFPQAAKGALAAIAKAKYLLSHNAEFDLNIFKSELFRYGLLEELEMVRNKTELCSMTMTAPTIGLKDKIGNPKNPTLKELVKFALKEDLPAVHNSPADVEFVRKSLKQLVEKKLLTIPPEST